jgi:hypothetical protein
MIDLNWLEKQRVSEEKGLLLFNGQSFRLDSFSLENNNLVLSVSEMEYRIRGSIESMADEVARYGDEYLGHGLAIGALLKTSDGYYVFGQRNGKTQSKQKVDIIGGIVDSDVEVSENGLWHMLTVEMEEEASINVHNIKSGDYLGIFFSEFGNCILVARVELNLSRAELTGQFKQNDNAEMDDLIFVTESELFGYLTELGGYKLKMMEVMKADGV